MSKSCKVCHSTHKVTCYHCGGHGMITVKNHAIKSESPIPTVDSYNVVTCPICHGQKTLDCHSCSGGPTPPKRPKFFSGHVRVIIILFVLCILGIVGYGKYLDHVDPSRGIRIENGS